MKNTTPTAVNAAVNATALAANFQVTELEPRLENAWTQQEPEHPSCLDTNTCAEPL